MSTSKHFQSLIKNYSNLRRPVKFVSRISSKKFHSKRLFTSHCLSAKTPHHSFSQYHLTYSRLNHYTSQVSKAEQIHKESLPIYDKEHVIKFEDMLFEPPVKQEELLVALQKCKSLAEQMETFASTMALTSKDIENRKKFCKTLESEIKPFFNDTKILMYGSSVNGFGFKGCDIDMTLKTSVDPKEKVSSLNNMDVPLLSEVMSGKVSLQELSKLPPEGKLLFIYNIFTEYYKESRKPVVFIKEVPLIRFYHDKFNLKCDLTINNRVSLNNSKLLHAYANIDKRVAPFIRIIQGWAKNAELIGKRFSFNSYSINLLAIHFLQTRSPPIIPNAESIIISKNFEIDDMESDSFLDLFKNIPPSNNTEPLDELLREFFFYYLFFDFTRVVSPLTGTSIPRKEIISKKDCKFIVNTLCVQDPVCTSNNVAKLVESRMFMNLYSELIIICKMFQDNIIATPSSNRWGLMNIFNKPNRYDFRNFDVREPVSFTLPCVSKTIDDSSVTLQSSFTKISKVLLKVVEHALLFECGSPLEVKDVLGKLERQDKLLKEQKINRNTNLSSETMLEHFKKVNSENKLIFCCECKVSKNIWTGREFVQLDPSTLSLDLLNQEHLKSKMIAKKNEQNVSSKDQKKMYHSYLLECYIASKVPEPTLLVYFRLLPEQLNISYIQKLSVLGIFFKDFVPKLMKDLKIE